MNRRSLLHGLAAITALIVGLTGCSRNNPTAPVSSQRDADDAAQTVGIMMGRDNGVMLQQSAVIPTAMSSRTGPLIASLPKAKPSGNGTMILTVGNIAWELRRSWYDANDATQSDYNGETTARMVAIGRGRGDVSAADDTIAYRGQVHMDVRGLLASSAALRLAGTRRDTLHTAFTSRFRGERVRLNTIAVGSLDGVTQGKSADLNPWPAGGSATWILTIQRLPETATQKAVQKTAIVRFDGTPTPTLTVDQRFHYTVDLRTGELVRQPS